ncbi:MAG: hypothetical protein SPK52_02125 [Synergistales bacterium]|nr:hypothetical protein [Synergistales bacterium]
MAQRYNTTDGYHKGRERQDGSPKRDSKKDGLDKNTINSDRFGSPIRINTIYKKK